MAGSSQTPRLEYSPPPKVRATYLWRATILAVAGLTALSAWRYRDELQRLGRQAALLHHQRNASRYVLGAEALVYWEQATGSETPPPGAAAGQPTAGPGRWNRLCSHEPSAVHFYAPEPVDRISSLGVHGLSMAREAVFLHERRAGEKTMLVFVSPYTMPRAQLANPSRPPSDPKWFLTFYAAAIQPAGWDGVPRQASYKTYTFVEINRTPFGGLRYYAGQPDPQDHSHFTVGYSTPEGRGIIDGWLLADGTVKLHVRSGPATQPVR